LKRFFEKAKDGYQIAKSIRATCVFAQQNVIRDPPFYNLDLISCCNVLIYFGSVLQRKALSTFHYALKPGGVLMLGPSESVGPLSLAFSPLGKKLKLYSNRRKPTSLNIASLAGDSVPTNEAVKTPSGGGVREALTLQRAAERMLLAQYAPAGVIVDDALNIVHVRGDVGSYLQLAPGEPTYGLLRMAREGLVVGLRTALLKARQRNASVSERAHVKHNGQFKDVNLRVIPINDPSIPALHLMVVFEDVATLGAPGPESGKEQKQADSAKSVKTSATRGARENARLKQELTATRDYLQSIIEEQEASTEELKSANEEAQASNEELETAKEELQSTNEELNTVNDELKTRNTALTELNNDLSNVLTGINVPMIMVGRDLRIRRFTPSMEPMLNLIESDVGRSILDLKPNIDVPDLAELLRGVIHGVNPPPREIEGPKGGWFSLQTLPYKTDNKIDGALLVLLDVDAVRAGRGFAEAVIETVRQPLVVLNKDLKVMRVNRAFYESFKVRKEETEGRFIRELGNGQWSIPKLLEALDKILPEKGGFEGFEIEYDFENIGRKTMVLNAREIRQETPFGGPAILLAIEDITGRKQAEAALLNNQVRLQRVNEDLQHFAFAASHDLLEPLPMVTSYAQLISKNYKGKLDQNADQYIGYAVEGAQRMEDLLAGMREYWQAGESGAEHHSSVDCNDALAKALLNLREAVTGSGTVVTHDSLPTVWAEEVMLVQIFQNLIGNAIKYRSKKPPRVHIAGVKNGTEEWVFSVQDNGIGIDPKYSQKIFEMFSRLNGRDYPGSGIGLALCKKLVEQFGGRIWVESMPGRGANFKFTIPNRE
jgi:two-component system CheB/CheR fusion protein